MTHDMPDTETKAVLAEHDVDTTDVAQVALMRHADSAMDTGRLCMVINRKPLHIELTREQEFRVINSLPIDQARQMESTLGETPHAPDDHPGYTTALLDLTDKAGWFGPKGQFLITIDNDGDISLAFRETRGATWSPPAVPDEVGFHPYAQED